MYELSEAAGLGPRGIENKSIDILNMVLRVMMMMETVYTVAVSLESHKLRANRSGL